MMSNRYAAELALRADPAGILELCGMEPDRWQADLMRSSHKREHIKVHRQGGKSTTIGARLVKDALFDPGCLQLIGSPTQRQSVELFRKVKGVYRIVARTLGLKSARFEETPIANLKNDPLDIEQWTVMHMELRNGSRIIALPDNPDAVRGFSKVRRVVIDESAYTSDEFHMAVRPMLAVSDGDMYLTSTPGGKRGYFWETSEECGGKSSKAWHHVHVPIMEPHPRIKSKYLDEERALGERYFAQEWECKFIDTDGAVFRPEDIKRAFASGVAESEW